MKGTSHNLLKKLKHRYLLTRVVESGLLALGIGLIAYSLTSRNISIWISISISVGVAFVSAFFYSKRIGLWTLTEIHIAHFLNRFYSTLQDSSDLLTSELGSSALQQLQRQRVDALLLPLIKQVKFPHRIPAMLLVFALGILAFVLVPTLAVDPLTVDSDKPIESTSPASGLTAAPEIKSVTVKIVPPPYTGAAPAFSAQLPLKVREGSVVTWTIGFSQSPENPKFIFSGKEFVDAKVENSTVYVNRKITESGFYQMTWSSNAETILSDFYPIEVVADEPPSIRVKDLPQFTELKITDNLKINLRSQFQDDYGLKDAHIIATVSKGSGESVKFREEKLRFSTPSRFSHQNEEAFRVVDLKQLGLEPGDELYFYIEAFDNKQPNSNKSRTETFFVAVQDTATHEAVADEGLGVDLMPEYFRSQRQIIMDSEKLLAEQRKIEKQEFNSRSNELGYDQKVLRLRYGQFMGEEFETAIGPGENHEEEEAEETDPSKQFGHQHDTENEHNLVADKKAPAQEHHDHGKAKDGKNENPLEAFAHNHDNTEEATFFIQSIKAKLRAALTLMWDAELYLRMYQPEKSLPYQYKILTLLKEISNDSRVYVHRTGFDPPPLKEEKRLSGDLSEIRSTISKSSLTASNDFLSIRNAINVLSEDRGSSAKFDDSERSVLQKAGNELAEIAIQNPGVFLKGLSDLKQLTESETIPTETREAVLKVLWKALPSPLVAPAQKEVTVHAWEEKMVQDLQSAKENE